MAPLGNLVSSGKLLKQGKYMPNLTVDVYDDGLVVLTDHGSAYDGNMGNLIAFCKESSATYVAQGLPKPSSHAKHERKESKGRYPVKGPHPVPETLESTKVERKHDYPGGILEVIAKGATPIKESPPLVTAAPVNAYRAVIPTSHMSLHEYEKFANQTSSVLQELTRAAIAGLPPDKSHIRSTMSQRGDAEPAIDIPPGIVKRGGTLEQLFNKYRSIPDEELFTEDVGLLFENKFEGEVQLAHSKIWMDLVSHAA
jgi:hypothetical protein